MLKAIELVRGGPRIRIFFSAITYLFYKGRRAEASDVQDSSLRESRRRKGDPRESRGRDLGAEGRDAGGVCSP